MLTLDDYIYLSHQATIAADAVAEQHFDVHRGAMTTELHFGEPAIVLFGNDSYARDERTRRQVELVRDALVRYGIRILGFGVDTEESYSWAILVDSEDEDLGDLVWAAWAEARGLGMQVLPDATRARLAVREMEHCLRSLGGAA